MKKLLLFLLLLTPIIASSQQLATLDRYAVLSSYIIHKHDSIALGKPVTASQFQYIYTTPGHKNQEYLPFVFEQSKVLVRELTRFIWTDDSSSVYAIIVLNNHEYYIDIDRAVDSGEINLSTVKHIRPSEIAMVKKKKQILFGKDPLSPVTVEGRLKDSMISCFIIFDDYRKRFFADDIYAPRAEVLLNLDQMKQLSKAFIDVQNGETISIAPNYKIQKVQYFKSCVYAFIKTNNEKRDPAGELFFLYGAEATKVSEAISKFINKYDRYQKSL